MKLPAKKPVTSGARARTFLLLFVTLGLSLPMCAPAVGIWTALTHTAPGGQMNNMVLLPDGTVMAHDVDNALNWYKLTPVNGSYLNGTWSTLPAMNYSREYFSSQVLPDDRVFVAGGEYGSGGTNGEVYDSVANTWTLAPNTPGYNNFLDSCSEILPNGNIMVAPVSPASYGETLIWNTNNSWSVGPTLFRGDDQDEAAWLKLPDNSILTIDPFGQDTERYIPSLNKWINDSTVPVTMYGWGGELGASFLLPNGNAFFLGGTNHTAIYTPTGTTNAGAWTAGPDIPNNYGVIDGPAAMMPNGNILCCVGTNGSYGGPSYFYEYNYLANSFTAAPSPTSSTAGASFGPAPFVCAMLDLPDGSVLFSRQSSQLYIYTPGGTPVTNGIPAINTVSPNFDGSYHLTGTLFNGISEGAAYGDDMQMRSDYPIARLTNSSGTVYYGRTYNWSNLGVMTGTNIVSTDVAMPTNLPAGTYSLVIVANGIASAPVQIAYPNGFVWNIWTGNVNANWDIATTANWSSNSLAITYADGSAVQFNDTSAQTNVNITTTVSPVVVLVTNNLQNYTFSGSPVSGSGSLIKSGSGMLTLANANNYSGGTTVSAGVLQLGLANAVPGGTAGGDITVNGRLDLNTFNESLNGLNGSGIVDTLAGGTPTLTLGANGDSGTFSGIIRNTLGTLTLLKTGSGTETLSGANAYAGGTILAGGTLGVKNSGGLGSGLVIVTNSSTLAGYSDVLTNPFTLASGQTLTLSSSVTMNGQITGPGNLAAGGGTVVLAGAKTYTGLTAINSGILVLGGGNNTLSNVTTLSFAGTGTLVVSNVSQTVSNLMVADSVTGTLTNGGTLIVNGAANVRLGNTNSGGTAALNLSSLASFTYTNPAGIFDVGGQYTGSSSVSAYGNLWLATNSAITASQFSIGDNGSSYGGTIYCTGTVWMGQSTTINANTLKLGTTGSRATPAGFLQFQTNLANPTLTLRAANGGAIANNIILGEISDSSYPIYAQGTIDLMTGVAGLSTLNASLDELILGQHTYDATVNSPAIGSFLMGGGTLNATALIIGQRTSTSTGLGSARGTFSLNGGTVTVSTITLGDQQVNQSATNVTGTFNLNSGIVQAQTIKPGANTATRAFNWNGGTITNYGSGTNLTIASGLTLTLGGTGSPAFGVGAGLTTTVNAVLAGTNGLTLAGNGMLVLNAANSCIGTTTVNGGILQVNGSLGTNTVSIANTATLAGIGEVNGATTVHSGGILAPGDAGIGTLVFNHSLTLNPGSAVIMELSNAGSSLTNNQAIVTGTLSLGGALTVTNIGSSTLAAGDSFTLFQAGVFNGAFSSLTLPELATNLVWDTSQLTNDGTIDVEVAPAAPSPPQNLAISPVASGLQLTFSGDNGQTYRVLGSTNLLLPMTDWTELTNGTFGTGPAIFTDSLATNQAGFYRITSP